MKRYFRVPYVMDPFSQLLAHVEALLPTVRELAAMEAATQDSFLLLRRKFSSIR